MENWKIHGKPALVILHMQEGITGKKGVVPGAAEIIEKSGIIPRQQALLKAFRSRHLPVIFLSALHVSREQNPVGVLPAYGNLFKMIALAEQAPHNLDIIPEVAPQKGEPHLINWLLGAFNDSGLDQVLKVQHVDTLVLAGFATNMVVYTTTVQAVDLWYSVLVAGDACAAMDPKSHEAALEFMFPNVAMVSTTDDIIAHL
jgi:nicotinamidase-related amidase